jgi:hypothetical protein
VHKSIHAYACSGAMATLAAYDVAQLVKGLEGAHADVSCITFGAPRPGNSAFARDFQTEVRALACGGVCWPGGPTRLGGGMLGVRGLALKRQTHEGCGA